MVDELMIHLQAAPTRIVATTIAGDAQKAQDFDWRSDDILLIGNEYDGLSEPVVNLAHRRLMIPMPPGHLPKPRSIHPIDRQRHQDVNRNGAPSLNTAVAASILCFLSYLRSSGMDCGASAD